MKKRELEKALNPYLSAHQVIHDDFSEIFSVKHKYAPHKVENRMYTVLAETQSRKTKSINKVKAGDHMPRGFLKNLDIIRVNV